MLLLSVEVVPHEERKHFVIKVLIGVVVASLTHFAPDEHWQSSEVAYYHHFKRGHLTWEWHAGLRSYIFPKVIQGVYKIGSFIGLDYHPLFLACTPLVLQGFLSYIAYLCYYDFVYTKFGRRYGSYANYLMKICWFTTYCCARPIINQTEFSLNCIGLYLLNRHRYGALTFVVGVNFMMRPTAAMFWLPMMPEIFLSMFGGRGFQEKLGIFFKCCAVGLMTLGYGVALDFNMTGSISFLRFLDFNVSQGGSALFGTHPYLWYLYNALPCILGPFVVFIPLGAVTATSTKGGRDAAAAAQRYFIYIVLYIFAYSCLPHKEIRFLLPVLPLIFAVLGCAIPTFEDNFSRLYGNNCSGFWVVKGLLNQGFLSLNIVALLLVGCFHQMGTMLASFQVWQAMSGMANPHVWVMMPCYSIPVNVFMNNPHANIEYYICPPAQYLHFYNNNNNSTTHLFIQPNGFNSSQMVEDIKWKLNTERDGGGGSPPPDFVLTYSGYVPAILQTFEEEEEEEINDLSYVEFTRTRYSVFPEVGREFLVVLCKQFISGS